MTLTVDSGHEAHAWLTSFLRPAGTLDAAATGRLTVALTTLASSSDMVVLDLTATRVSSPERLAVALRAPAQQLASPARCLLLLGAGPDVVAELNRADVPAVLAEAPPSPLRESRPVAATALHAWHPPGSYGGNRGSGS